MEEGKRFSHVYLDRGSPTRDSERFRNRLAAYYDQNKHAVQVETLISKKVDVIVITPVDSFIIGESITKANKAGIPVITTDTANMSEKGKVISHITSDNFQGGKLAAKLLARSIKYKGKAVILSLPTIESCIERVKGFKKAIEIYPDIEVLDELPVKADRKETEAIVQKILQEKKVIDGIFAVSDELILGALKAVESKKISKEIMLVGYDAIPEVRTAIADGRIYADVRQFPIKIGQETIKIINEHFEGIKVPPIVHMEVGTWT